MSIKRLCANAVLAALLFAVFFMFSQILYLEFVTLTIILLALNIPKYNSIWIVTTFVVLVWLVYGLSLWSFMYIIIYPGFTLLLKALKPLLSKSVYFIAIFGFLMALLAGNLIDLPFLLFSKEITLFYVLMGFRTTLIQGGIAFLAVLFLYEPLAASLQKILNKGDIYA